jgi:hypothetical protein
MLRKRNFEVKCDGEEGKGQSTEREDKEEKEQ